MISATPTAYEHIALDADGVAWIAAANTKVVELLAAARAHGWSAEELAYQHPHLTLAQVHSALAYYRDHQQQLDAELRRRADAEDRADPTLIEWMLGLTPEQRLDALQGFVNSVWELRHGSKA